MMECVDSLFPVDSFVKRKNTNCHVQCSCLLIMEYKWYTNRDIPFRDRQDGSRGASKPPRCTNAPRNHNVHGRGILQLRFGAELIDTYRKLQLYLQTIIPTTQFSRAAAFLSERTFVVKPEFCGPRLNRC